MKNTTKLTSLTSAEKAKINGGGVGPTIFDPTIILINRPTPTYSA
jgi:hypothetical protein